jgi:hypothetical protein
MKIDNKPHTLTKYSTNQCWWYEHPKSLTLYYEQYDGAGRYVRTNSVNIQYRTLVTAMKRAGYLKDEP